MSIYYWLVVSNKAFKLAEKWVDGMSRAADYDPTELELEARPSRLGLGAKVARQVEVGPLNDAVERKLYSKLNAENDSDEGEPSGRSQAFSKKKADPSNLYFLPKKK
uniref:Uncharacterized protein n=1 Tax=Kalanchoe fedtschenkoi TaxID=63787 RepID=A0A7N0RA82_KALFE